MEKVTITPDMSTIRDINGNEYVSSSNSGYNTMGQVTSGSYVVLSDLTIGYVMSISTDRSKALVKQGNKYLHLPLTF